MGKIRCCDAFVLMRDKELFEVLYFGDEFLQVFGLVGFGCQIGFAVIAISYPIRTVIQLYFDTTKSQVIQGSFLNFKKGKLPRKVKEPHVT